MNEWERELMYGPTVRQRCCVFCGRPAENQHHVILRSHGGTDGPTISVCGMGNASGCHGKLHDGRIHLRVVGGKWEFAAFAKPTSRDKARERWEQHFWLPIFDESEVPDVRF